MRHESKTNLACIPKSCNDQNGAQQIRFATQQE